MNRENRKIKIGLLIPNLQSGGAEKVLCNMSKILSKDYEVYILVFDSENISYEFSGQLIDIKCKARRNIILKVLIRLIRVIKLTYHKIRLKPDMMISFMNSANMVNIMAGGKSKKIISCRSYSEYKLYKRQYYRYFNKIAAFIVQTQRMKNEFTNEFNVNECKVYVINNPFDIKRITEDSKQPIADTYQDFIKKHETICTVGSFKSYKGLWHLIKAFHITKVTIKDAGLIIIGYGGPMEKEIKQMASESPYSKDILLLGYQKNPAALVAKSDVYVCSSIYEGFPNALVEAMLCETPIVSTDCLTGPRELLCDNINIDVIGEIYEAERGILVPPLSEEVNFDLNNVSENEKLLSEAINRIIIKKDKASETAARAYKRAKSYNFESFYQKLSNIINDL